MEIKEPGHIVLYVRDINRSARSSRDMPGWRQILPADGHPDLLPAPYAAFNAPPGRTHHELLLIEAGPDGAAQPEGTRAGLYHFGLKAGTTDDELREAPARLRKSGPTISGTSDHGVSHSIHTADPDGNQIELYIDPPGVDWNDPATISSPARPLHL